MDGFPQLVGYYIVKIVGDISFMEALYPWLFFAAVGGLIGYFTNWMAVKMIFRPRQPVMGIQGLIPRRHDDLANKIGETVSNHLITEDDIRKMIPFDKMEEHFLSVVGDKVDEFIDQKFLTINPMIAAFLSDDLRAKIKNGVIEKMQELLPDVESQLMAAATDFDVSSLVKEKVNNFDTEKLESIILEICRKELRAIEILGGVLGATVGLVQYWIVSQGWF